MIKKILTFILDIILFLTAYILFLPLSIINFCLVRDRGYFRSSALNLDKYANRELRTLWNATLRKSNGYKFGLIDETISGVLGKNKRANTLSRTGKVLAYILDRLDKDHCIKSIDDSIFWEKEEDNGITYKI